MKYLFVVSLLILSCKGKVSESKKDSDSTNLVLAQKKIPKLWILKKISDGTLGKNDLKSKDSVSLVNSEYFEITLEVMMDLKTWRGRKTVEETVNGNNYHSIDISLTDEKGEELSFEGSTSFLNFMFEHGYSMVDQVKTKHHVDYTFKRNH